MCEQKKNIETMMLIPIANIYKERESEKHHVLYMIIFEGWDGVSTNKLFREL